jgi:hypothetical protein
LTSTVEAAARRALTQIIEPARDRRKHRCQKVESQGGSQGRAAPFSAFD